MSNSALKILAASGAKDEAVYVDDVFSTYLYEGNGTSQTITNGIDLAGKGGLVWTKARESTSGGNTSHALIDTERGKTNWLSSNTGGTEATNANLITAFNSNGYTVGSGGPYWTNDDGYDYASWTFRKQSKFFDIVTYTGNGTAGRTVSHNLGSVPGMIIVKRTDGTNDWQVYHRGVDATAPEDYYLPLNQTNARIDSDVRWNDTAPTATEFTVGSSGATNGSGGNYVAYLFAHDEQDFGTDSDESIIKCGSYEGNGGTKKITLGFEPQWILFKNVDDGSNNWMICDIMRGAPVSDDTEFIEANTSSAEQVGGGSGSDKWWPTATGFTVAAGGGGANDPNENNETYIYVAIRRPHKPASEFAATELHKTVFGSSGTSNPAFVTDFPVDMAWKRNVSSGYSMRVHDRLRGKKELYASLTNAEGTDNNAVFDFMDGYYGSGVAHHSWMFRRAPGFFDVVAYTGQSAAMEIDHNLGVTPELIIQKCRTQGSGYNWNSWYTGLTNSQYINFNDSTGVQSSSNLWGTNSTVATDSIFRVGAATTGVNGGSSNTHIAYLFASADGISKVGTFNRPSQVSQDVDCGFTNGARLVLLKRTNTTGNWVLWDSVRGIVAGNDPYILTNNSSAQITNQDYIDPLSSGFTLTSGIATGDWVFLAIA